MANAPTICGDITEAIDLFPQHGLYLKPIAKLSICVQMPQLKTPGKSISNWEVMEKLKQMIAPDEFIVLKVSKSALEFVRFEGELENKAVIPTLLARLDNKTMKLSGFTEQLKVRACEAKIVFPSRHDWEAYFRDAKHMNEMKPGERPDTIHFSAVPAKWFAARNDKVKDKPSDFIVRKVFETFGDIRCIDIPCLDEYRQELTKSQGIQTFSFSKDLFFETYIQYKEYVSFVKTMTALRGMKLMYKDADNKAYTTDIKADFDKTKHLSDKNIRKRRLEREKLKNLEKEREERVRREREEEERRKEEERKKKEEEGREKLLRKKAKAQKKRERQREREEKRRQRRLAKKQEEEERKMALRIAQEERRILIAQRKLESMRLLTELFDRVKEIKAKEDLERRLQELEVEKIRAVEQEKQRLIDEAKRKREEEKHKKAVLKRKEEELRQKIMRNFKRRQEEQHDQEREQLRKKLAGTTRLKSVLAATAPKKKGSPRLRSVLVPK